MSVVTALFNAPSFVVGAVLGMVIGALIVENGANNVEMKQDLTDHNQLVADCESRLPRNKFCELVAREVKQ